MQGPSPTSPAVSPPFRFHLPSSAPLATALPPPSLELHKSTPVELPVESAWDQYWTLSHNCFQVFALNMNLVRPYTAFKPSVSNIGPRKKEWKATASNTLVPPRE